MPVFSSQEQNEIFSKVKKEFRPKQMIPTGSQFFGDASEDSDIDFVLLVNNFKDITAKLDKPWKICGDDETYEAGEFFIVRKDDVNLIFTDSENLFNLWVKCNCAASHLELNREQRAALFHIMIDKD